MAEIFEVDDLRGGYVDIVKHIAEKGVVVAPRGQVTYEILDATIVLRNPRDAMPIGVGRKLNPAIGAAEAVQLIGGRSHARLITNVSPAFKFYAEADGKFWGSYGQRVGKQVIHATDKLIADHDTRQAVITLWDPHLDNMPGKRDYPCTVMMQFMLRSGKLTMHTTMRSNDVWLGVAYDVFQFTQLQLTIARALGVEVGEYHHHANSLHLYERDFDSVKELRTPTRAAPSDHPTGFGEDDWTIAKRQRIRLAVARADLLSRGATLQNESKSEAWYRRTLEPYV